MKKKSLFAGLICMAAVFFAWVCPVNVQASAVRVDFEQNYANGTEQAVITAYAEDGTVAWTRNTDSYPAAQLSSCRGFGIYDGKYYYSEGGAVYMLDLADGSVIWENAEFSGASANHFMDADGTLYVCGYFGPDLFVVDKDGNTLARIDKVRENYNWPYEIEVNGDVIRIHYEQNGQYLELSKEEILHQSAGYTVKESDSENVETGEDQDSADTDAGEDPVSGSADAGEDPDSGNADAGEVQDSADTDAGEDPDGGSVSDTAGIGAEIYGSVLDTFIARNTEAGYEEFTRYGLYDIDGDGTEELFIWDDTGIENDRGYVVYACRGTQAVEIGKILRDCELRGYEGCILEKHFVPRDNSEIINRYWIQGDKLYYENLHKQPAGEEIPDSVKEWTQGTPLEFTCSLNDRSCLGGEASDETEAPADTEPQPQEKEEAPEETEPQTQEETETPEETEPQTQEEEEAPADTEQQPQEEAKTPEDAEPQTQEETETMTETRLYPTDIRASSELEPYYSSDYSYYLYTYYASCVDDGEMSTAWNEGAEGPGIGEYLEFDFPAGTVITGGVIYPGFYDYEDLFYQNNAPTLLEISSGGTSVTLDVEEYGSVWQDGFQGYTFSLDQKIVSDGCVRVTIRDVRLGYLYDDTCITELYFYGYPAKEAGSQEEQADAGRGTDAAADISEAQIGDLVLFGTETPDAGQEDLIWQVLDRKEDRLLLITRDVLDAPQYSDDNYYPVWSESNIRSWLNNEFYWNAFTGEEKERIIPADVTFTTILGEDGVWGEETVTDNVFLLNAVQAEQFFASNEDRRADVSDKTDGTAVTENGAAPWWLIGVGFESQGAAQVTSSGEIDTYGISVENRLGVRPVIWVSL